MKSIELFASLVPSIIFTTFCIVPISVILFIFKRKINKKKSPLNMELLRSPGQTLQNSIEDLTWDILYKILLIPIVPCLLYSVFLTHFLLSQKQPGRFIILYIIGLVIFILWVSKDVYEMMKKRNLLRLGMECEMAVGQELLDLTTLGFKVFHDFPAHNFNIDHIAIGPQGVFAIETKGRAKLKKQEKDNWKLKFDGKKLIFPGWCEDRPIQQAKNQSVWLKKWLEKSTGEKHKIIPVLAIPGWWIDLTGKSEVKVYNGKNPSFLAKGPVVLNGKQIKTISFQIENKCRDVESKSYNV